MLTNRKTCALLSVPPPQKPSNTSNRSFAKSMPLLGAIMAKSVFSSTNRANELI